MKAKNAIQTAMRGLGYSTEDAQYMSSFIGQERGIQYTLKQTYYGDEEKECKCTQQEIHRYLNKISGPLLDRIDLHIEVKRPQYEKITSKIKSETSEEIRKRVNIAKNIQRERYKNENIVSNSELTNRLITKYCKLDPKGEEILKKAFEKLKLSVRAYEKILKIARTIADLEQKNDIEYKHVAEAIQYRSLDRRYDN